MNPVPDNGQRRFSRISFHTDVQLHFGQDAHLAQLLDIALKGALVALQQPLDGLVGKGCQLKLHLGGGEAIVMEGVVAHQEGLHVGIECRHIDVDSLTRLRRLAELNLGDEALLDRELSRLFNYQ
ncbi:MAG: PilZ domain-containing protein [Sulfurimicrobium sp.]|nr:PilZ domain-containing protein [Sulfurimicrobium sp.]